MKKRALSVLLLAVNAVLMLAMSGCGTETAEKLKPSDRFFVNDFANVLSSDDEETIYALGVQLQEKTKAQVVAVTINSLDGKDIREYGLELARDWAIGEKDKDTGVLLLVAVDDRKVSIEVGYGLEGGLTDIETSVIIDTYAKPYFKNNDFSSGMREAYKALTNEVYIEFGIEPEKGYIPAKDRTTSDSGVTKKNIFSFLPVLVVILILFSVISRRGRRGGGPPFIFFGGGGRGGFGGGGGGFSGGDGGGFSGGGGSFGGGGSSSSF